MAAARHEYANPPIAEALCQFEFSERLPWNVATPGILFERLRDEYPMEPGLQEIVQANFQAPEGGNEGQANLSVNRGDQRFIYRDKSGVRLLVANAATMSANSLKPYEGWPSLKGRFTRGVERLNGVAEIPGIAKVLIRYINRIAVPTVEVDTDDYFTMPVLTAQHGEATYSSFINRVQSVLDDGQTFATVTFASILNEGQGVNEFLLDLEFERRYPDAIDIDEGLRVADELKELEDIEFEASITDKARELFA